MEGAVGLFERPIALPQNHDDDQVQFNLRFSLPSLTHSENNLPVFTNSVWELTPATPVNIPRRKFPSQVALVDSAKDRFCRCCLGA